LGGCGTQSISSIRQINFVCKLDAGYLLFNVKIDAFCRIQKAPQMGG